MVVPAARRCLLWGHSRPMHSVPVPINVRPAPALVCRFGGDYIVGRQGTADTFEHKLPNWFDYDGILYRHQHSGTD